uniref:Uncharacterized protein n=1 Tax=Sphaerodactylus townsendi TaxID=933632 RepID=A0ACB8GDM6_9SAUR
MGVGLTPALQHRSHCQASHWSTIRASTGGLCLRWLVPLLLRSSPVNQLQHIVGSKIQKEIYEDSILELYSSPPLVDLSLFPLGIVPEDCHIIHHTE